MDLIHYLSQLTWLGASEGLVTIISVTLTARLAFFSV